MTFGFDSTTEDVLSGVDLSGRRVLVTGASAGLGVETIRALSKHGADMVGAARSLEKARRALDHAGALVSSLVELDLASLASVRAAADKISAEDKPFDVIIANAGVMACPFGTTADGFETQFGTNHLGHFVFVNRLIPMLKNHGRIVNLASAGHRTCDVNLEDPGFTNTPYDPWIAYGRSKTANVLFAVGLDQRLKNRGIRACAVHPGGIQTELGRHLTPELIEAMMRRAGPSGFKFKSIPQGAATSVWCAAVAPAADIGGRYCEDCNVADINDAEFPRTGVMSYAVDAARANALWSKSEEMVAEKFAFN